MPPKRAAPGTTNGTTQPALPNDDISDIGSDAEVSEEDDEDEQTTGLKFQPLEKLRGATYKQHSIADLVQMLSSPFLNLNPEYQRDVVWTADRMTKLIDSLMANYYIPPIIFHVTAITTDSAVEPTKWMRTAIDGKQRLTSIREFVAGRIPCTDVKGRKWYYCQHPERTKTNRILPISARRMFLSRIIICTEFAHLEKQQEEDLFSRVQLGIPLNPAEKLRATSGPWQSFAIDLGRCHPELMDLVGAARGRAFQQTLLLLRQLVHEDDVDSTISTSAVKTFCANQQNFCNEAIKIKARQVFHIFQEIHNQYPETFENHGYRHSTKFSPVEFVGVGTLISKYPERNTKLLSNDILHLRAHLRENHDALRSNPIVWATIRNWIDNIERYRGGVGVIERSRREETTPLFSGSGTDAEMTPAPEPSRNLKRTKALAGIKEEAAVKRERFGP